MASNDCEKAGAPGLLTRLRRDRRGNVLGIVAAAIFPITGLIGSGLDLSRAYLVRTRLQQACDAGVLAGRKMMGAGGSMTAAVRSEVSKFVNFNFPQRSMDTAVFSIAPAHNATTDVISLTLSTSMDTAIMQLFGVDDVAVEVACTAHDDYANLDIMLVLDTTGSMACKAERNEDNCSDWLTENDRRGKTMKVGDRTVTYSLEETNGGGVNTSRMQGLRNAVATLQTQMGQIETQFQTAAESNRKRVRWAVVPFSQMTNPGLSVGPAGTTLYQRRSSWFNRDGEYRRGRDVRTSTHSNDWVSKTWDGCTEERTTSPTITPTSGHSIPSNLPSNAHDLAFDRAPTNAATRWTMADPGMADGQYACPKPMREWGSMTKTEFNDYFKLSTGFVANGGTHLHLGVLWAARMLSRTGLWQADNPIMHNGFPVRRVVIFMTDGEMDIGPTGYSAYGQEHYWKRLTSDGTRNSVERNAARRFLMTCETIKNMSAEIFVISFGAGSTLNADLKSCSSGTGYAFKADDNAQLQNVFRDIGNNIGSLRLSQ